jgi:ribosomal protein L14
MRRGTIWNVVDNCGIKTAKELNIVKYKRHTAYPGDMMKVVPQKYKIIKRIERKQKYWGLVLNVNRRIRRAGGVTISAYTNSLVVLDKRLRFTGSKIFGPAMREFKYRRSSYTYKRILARVGYFI